MTCFSLSHSATSPGLMLTVWLLLAMGTVCITGCGGCTGDDPNQKSESKEEKEKKEKEEKEKKKPPVVVGPIVPLLNTSASDELAENPAQMVKPGHWTATVQRIKANDNDFVGESTIAILDEKSKPVRLKHTPFTLGSHRPVVLAKDRSKRIEGEIFVPENFQKVKVRATVHRSNSSSERYDRSTDLTSMPAYQYFLIVLAKEPSRYAFLKVTDTVRAPWEEELEQNSSLHYRVLLVSPGRNTPIPSNVLTWTSVAYLLWDEVDPTQLSIEQQDALVDWLHWGGRLIINGPDSLDMLRGSFLEPWLPAESDGPRTIATGDLQPWNDYWTQRSQGRNIPPLVPIRPWSGIKLLPREQSLRLAGTAGLFYQRQVGSGSVLVSAIQLHQRELINWPGYDSFLNAALLGRPQRRFLKGPYNGSCVDWANYPKHRLDAHFTTGLRMFARDAQTSANTQRIETTGTNQSGQIEMQLSQQVDRPGGVGAWNELGPVSQSARESLRDAAGVRVPGKGFVVACLAIYLAVLVPLNWMVFRAIDRVEWAWIAAPIIALLGTIVVVRQAQLDIGFVRSQTEIALLELQGDYSRGHLSRYTAFYTSLSTTYDVAFDSRTTVATPFPADATWKPVPGARVQETVFEKHKDTFLRGLTISSNTTQMVHSEQMFEMDGALRLGESSRGDEQVENQTGLDLRDVAVVRRKLVDGKPRYYGCWLGDIRNGSSAVLGFPSTPLQADQIPFADERKSTSTDHSTKLLNIDPLLKIAFAMDFSPQGLQTGEEVYRLVGRVDQVLPGEEASPESSQIHGTTVVLAHLKRGPAPAPQPDVNSREDIVKKDPL